MQWNRRVLTILVIATTLRRVIIKNSLTFPNCSKYCFTSSTTVLADKPPTNIFFVLVTIWKEKGERSGLVMRLQMHCTTPLMRLQTHWVSSTCDKRREETLLLNRNKRIHTIKIQKHCVLTLVLLQGHKCWRFWQEKILLATKSSSMNSPHSDISNWSSNQNRLSQN